MPIVLILILNSHCVFSMSPLTQTASFQTIRLCMFHLGSQRLEDKAVGMAFSVDTIFTSFLSR